MASKRQLRYKRRDENKANSKPRDKYNEYWRAYKGNEIIYIARSERELNHLLAGKNLGVPKRMGETRKRIIDARIEPPIDN